MSLEQTENESVGPGVIAPVHLQVDSGLGLVTFQDRANRNRLNPVTLAALLQAFRQLFADPAVKVVALRAAGPVGSPFCLGMDLDQLGGSLAEDNQDQAAAEAATRRQAVEDYGSLLELIAGGPKPVIALVGGPVKAGGVGLVAACDIVIASASASFELSEVLFGLIPANVIPWLIGRRMSLQRCRYLILSAACLDPQIARDFGLVDLVCPDDGADVCLKNLLKTMMRAEPGALAATKDFLSLAASLPAEELRPKAIDTLLDLMERPQTAAAIAAFADGRSPDWFQKYKPSGPQFWRTDV